ncbi:N-acetylmuramoyl-L-alanine amidase family protein [Emticicia sp. TH156]|uniref:peptidoglycan recognition protein family protein n=1 Tax=Emticicia sp. TH156 TaxID=2067454 RepID=UPI000C78525B|nr:peptidoglycan recognition family protein [Emticicia sp. TH156]PLK44428.1 N-acetylmuramoyl-L-alanine amidase [Emticicia sp. TH156]
MAFTEKFSIGASYLPKPSRRRSGLAIAKVRFLVAHDTGNPDSTAAGNISYYTNTAHTVPPKKTASAHIFVDDRQILECIPALTAPPEKAWHVLYDRPKDNELFGVNANDAAIGVEYCYGDKIDADKAYNKFVWVLAKLCYEFQLDPAKDIVGHFFLDPGRKTDPLTGLAHSRRTYEQLLKDVVEEYRECTGETQPEADTTPTETGQLTTAVRLNIRTQPNRRAAVVETVAARTVLAYTARTEKGEAINNNPVWYQTAQGNWFWDGGILHG